MKYFIIVIIIVLEIFACRFQRGGSPDRVFVIQEIKMNDSVSFFWFKVTGDALGHALNYFQFASDKCNLSEKKANANCDLAYQIFNVDKDTVFILTQTEIITTRFDNKLSIKAERYTPEKFDLKKGPSKMKQYYLDSVCNNY